MSDTYEFPHAIELELGDGQQTHVEVMRGDKGWVAVLVDGNGKQRYASGSGLSLDNALDDLAHGLKEAPPRQTERDAAIPVTTLRHLESKFTSEAFTLRLTRLAPESFTAEYWDPKAGVAQSAEAPTPARVLTELASIPPS